MRKFLILFLAVVSCISFAQDSIQLKIYRENVGKTFVLYADNDEHAPVSVEYSFTAENMSSSAKDKSVTVIPALAKKFLLTELQSIDPKKGTRFNYTAYYVLGDVNIDFKEKDIAYTLPFAKHKKHSVYQGYNGKFSHQNANSIDFSLQNGEQVFAAREGTIVQVIINNNKNCITKDCARFNNKITILHNDGTLAEYVHLKQNGSTVQIGEQVSQGQLIGYSGNTGWTKGPHLHFSVFAPKIDGERNYIKTKFMVTGNANPIYVEEKKQYSRSL
ncbi:M23 family metallopeptidase [Kaistella sp. SH11-4b]|nr:MULTISPECIES: M23 family metallopeptidase [unclassified Kaistella]MDP2454511.1 M23 family metallopeptidase [Kaistella sp. SH11-4b]MDP2457249.1 M23 family metallopeptidase [Kaistella sp. SH40-3]MDP2460009.1 M23 family metallopeptidase [Kaistella sp. SH19-2b]